MPCYHCAGWWWCNGVGDVFFRYTLGPLVQIGHCLNSTAYLSIVSDHVHPFMTTTSDGYFQQDNAPCHIKLESFQIGFLNMTMSSLYKNGPTVTRSQPNSVSFALDVHPTYLHQLQDAVQSIWVNIYKECFQSMPHRIKAVLLQMFFIGFQ